MSISRGATDICLYGLIDITSFELRVLLVWYLCFYGLVFFDGCWDGFRCG